MSEKLTDPREIRQLLTRVAYGGYTLDGKSGFPDRISMSSNMIHHAFAAAEHAGLSGEDKMTVLAYHALLRLDEVMDQYISLDALTPRTYIVPKPA